ncbi:MAG: HD domain-containing protein [Bradymonadia bacterium]
MDANQAARNVDIVIGTLLRGESQPYIGEPVSQLEHALQAAHFAQSRFGDARVTLAALLHDVGHLLGEKHEQMDGFGTRSHEHVGAEFLSELGFKSSLCRLVAQHVNAKRYLCYRNERYFQRLSCASRETLAWQGGPLNAAEAKAFEQDPDFEIILALRTIDEKSKQTDIDVPQLESYRDMLIEHFLK